MSPLTVALMAAAEGGGGGLTDINLGLTVWTVVLFAIFAFVLTRFGWRPLLNLIEEREKGVRAAVEGAHAANAEAQALLAQHKAMIREAGREREEIVKRALAEAEQLRADLGAKARAESDQIVARAKEQIEREKTQAILELRVQVADIAVAAAAKIVTSSMTPEAQKQMVQDFIANLPKVQ